MKKRVRKLTLNKETVRRLTDEELKGVAGGDQTHGNTCSTCPSTCASTCSGCGTAHCDTCDLCDTTSICMNSCGGATCSGPGCP